jgi:hypothetical protein
MRVDGIFCSPAADRVLFDNELMAQSMSRDDGLHWLISMQSFFCTKLIKLKK